MLQRRQSFFLALIALTAITLLFIPVAKVGANGSDLLLIKVTGLFKVDQAGITEKTRPMVFMFLADILITAFSVITIAMFRNRKLQIRLTLILAFLCLAFILITGISIIQTALHFNYRIIPGIALALPAFMLLFCFLAQKGIKKDEEMVRSIDRLR